MTKTANNNSPLRKIISAISTILTVLICAATAIVLVKIVISRVSGKPASFLGTSFAIVVTPSMEPEIMTGDLIVFHTVSYDDINVGDNIVFIADDSFKDAAGGSLKGYMIVHKVVEISESGVVTKGVNNAVEDDGYREATEILGICTFNSAALGTLFSFLGKYGIVIILLLVTVPIIVKLIIKIVKYSKDVKQESANENHVIEEETGLENLSEENNDNNMSEIEREDKKGDKGDSTDKN